MLTFAHLRLARASLLQLIEAVDHGEDLYGADCVEHVGIVAGRGAEAAGFVLAGQHEVYGLIAGQGVRVPKQV